MEIGTYSFAIQNSFRKAFISANVNHVEFELLPPKKYYDGCGLGRIILKDMPWGMLPVMSFANEPYYLCAKELKFASHAAAAAPVWLDKDNKPVRLAENYVEDFTGIPDCMGLFKEIAPALGEVVYNYAGSKVTYRADLSQAGVLNLQVTLEGDAKNAFMVVPVLKNNGADKPALELKDNTAIVVMRGKTLTITGSDAPVTTDGTAVNRTGEYTLLKFPMKNNRITLIFKLSAEKK